MVPHSVRDLPAGGGVTANLAAPLFGMFPRGAPRRGIHSPDYRDGRIITPAIRQRLYLI